MVDANGQLSIWNLMQILNEVKGGRMNQLLLNVRFEDNVKSMDLKIYDNAYLEEELVVESSFTPIGKRTVDLKIYVSRRKKGMPVKRVCKAVYTLGIHAVKQKHLFLDKR